MTPIGYHLLSHFPSLYPLSSPSSLLILSLDYGSQIGLTLFLSSPMYLHSLFKLETEEPKKRKPWYQRAMEIAAGRPPPPPPPISGEPTTRKLRKSSSLREGATTFTRACLCAPIFSSSTAAPERRRPPPPERSLAAAPPRFSGEGRRLFRGKSLTDDLLMRRFVVEEAVVVQSMRRMSEMEFVRKRGVSRGRMKLGKSPLSRMTMADIP